MLALVVRCYHRNSEPKVVNSSPEILCYFVVQKSEAIGLGIRNCGVSIELFGQVYRSATIAEPYQAVIGVIYIGI